MVMDLIKEVMKRKTNEIILNNKLGNTSNDNVILYDIIYNNGSKLNYIEKFNDQFSGTSFIKRLLHDVKFSEDIQLIKIVITNEKYKSLSDCNLFYINENLKMNDQLFNNIEQVKNKINLYHMFSSSEFNKYDQFTDKDYALLNSIVDIIDSNETIRYGCVVNKVKLSSLKSNHRTFYNIQICSMYSIEKDYKNKLISGKVYKGMNFENKYSKNYIVKSFTTQEYLNNLSLLTRKTLIKEFPYLVDYFLELISWKNVNKTDIIPEEVYDVIKQKYMNSDKKVKEYIK